MSRHYRQIAITQDVLALRALNGTWHHGAPVGRADTTLADRLGSPELAFLADRHGFYVASVGATGWPNVQYRGGSPGSIRDNATLGWADFAGDEQYVTTGNIAGDDWVALIVMDYAGQRRLKAAGARVQSAPDVPDLVAALGDEAGPAAVERVVTVAVAAYDWNCPRHIVRRFTARELQPQVARLADEVEALRAEDRALRDQVHQAVAAGPER